MRLRYRSCLLETFFVLCVLATRWTSAVATDVETRAVGTCARAFDLDRALSNETLHEQVYYWANNHDVRDWQWEKTTPSPALLVRWDVSAAGGAELQCVGIRYSAGIRIPQPFESLLVMWHMSVEIPLRVEKVVCRGKGVLYEDATIHEPVLNEIRMSTKHVLATEYDLESTAKTTLYLPWYAQMLESQVSDAMSHSVAEKFDAVVRSLCEPMRNELRSVQAMRNKRRNLFSGWKGLFQPKRPFAGNTTVNASEAPMPRRPHRPLKPPGANETWVVILLPEDEPWPETADMADTADMPDVASKDSEPCKDGPCEKPKGGKDSAVDHKPRLAVRRRRVSNAAPQTSA